MAPPPNLTQKPPPGAVALSGVGLLFGLAFPFFILIGTGERLSDSSLDNIRRLLNPVGDSPLAPLTLLGVQVFIFGLSPLVFDRPRSADSWPQAGHRIKDHLNEASWASAVILVFISMYCVILILSAIARPENALLVGLIALFSILLSGSTHRLFLEMVDERSPAERRRVALKKTRDDEIDRLHRARVALQLDRKDTPTVAPLLIFAAGTTTLLTVLSALFTRSAAATVLLGVTLGIAILLLAVFSRLLSLAMFGRRDNTSNRALSAFPTAAGVVFFTAGPLIAISQDSDLSNHFKGLTSIILVVSAIHSLGCFLFYVEIGRNEIRERIEELDADIEAVSASLVESRYSQTASTPSFCEESGGYLR